MVTHSDHKCNIGIGKLLEFAACSLAAAQELTRYISGIQDYQTKNIRMKLKNKWEDINK